MNSPDKSLISLWDKWLKASGVDAGYGYRVPEQVWDAAWNGNWPDDEGTIQWIVQEYLDVEEAKAGGYLEIIIPLRHEAEAALNAAKRHRQVKIDADIDEVIKIIRGLGRESDEKTTATDNYDEDPIRSRNRRMRLVVITITIFAIGAFAGFVGAYNLYAPNGASDIRVIRSWEIRRAIPVEPEIRRAIPVQMEIRKAIPVQTREPEIDQPLEAKVCRRVITPP